MPNYDFHASLSPLDFELLSKDLLEAELGIRLENFKEGQDQGIDLRYAPIQGQPVIVQCKRYADFDILKPVIKKEVEKVKKLNPVRYIFTTSVRLSPQEAEEIKTIFSPFILSTDDVWGRDRLNSALSKHPEVERRHLKLWLDSSGVLDNLIHTGTHVVSKEEVEQTLKAARIYVQNQSFNAALSILEQHHVCIIAGMPGIGKTTLARMLLLYFYKADSEIIKIESNITEARNVGYHSKPRFYYYDDFLGQTAQADKLGKNEDQKLLDFMDSVSASQDSRLVLTTREYILNQAKSQYEKLERGNFDHNTCVLDLSHYSRQMKAHILYNHLHFSCLPKPFIENLISTKGYAKIVDHTNYNPRLIETITSPLWLKGVQPEQYTSYFIANLDDPIYIWSHAFDKQISSSARHLLYVLATLPQGVIYDDLQAAFTQLHNKICPFFGIVRDLNDFQSALKELDGTFIKIVNEDGIVFIEFSNPSIRDFVQNRIANGELIGELVENMVFFEQTAWFGAILKGNNGIMMGIRRHLSKDAVMKFAPAIIEKMKSLLDPARNFSPEFQLRGSVMDLPHRIGLIIEALPKPLSKSDVDWINNLLCELLIMLELDDVSADDCTYLAITIDIEELTGVIDGHSFIQSIKEKLMLYMNSIDGFGPLSHLYEEFNQMFSEDETNIMKEKYTAALEQYVEDIVENPDDSGTSNNLHYIADEIGLISSKFDVDTEDYEWTINNQARSKTRADIDIDFDPSISDLTEYFEDADMDSMFASLLS